MLLPDGEVLHCTPDNEHRELFFGLPNSYGTLGYALRLRLRTLPVKAYVQVQHQRHDASGRLLRCAGRAVPRRCRFRRWRGVRADRQVLSVARFVDDAPWLSDYTFENIYYRSLLERETDLLRHARLSVALGHRLVLVLQAVRRRSTRCCAGCWAASG